MEPFHVICETCHARLKIRTESVIGEIHACPKCESMVHIVPPAGWVPTVAPAAVEAMNVPMSSPTEVVAADMPMAAAGLPILAWGLGGAAILLVAAVIAIAWSGGGSVVEAPLPPVAIVTDPEPAAVDSQETEPIDATIEESAVEAQPDEPVDEPIAPPSTVLAPSAEASATVPPDDEVIAAEDPELPADNHAEVAEASKPASETTSAPTAVAASEPAPPLPPPPVAAAPKPVLKFDPLDFDPSQLSLGGTSGEAPAAASVAAEVAGAPEHVDAVSTVAANNHLPVDQGILEPEGDPAVHVRLGPMSADALRQRDVAVQLALPIESFDLTGVPLARLVDAVAEMADVPITMDPAALVMTGISPRANVTLQARDTSLEKMLRDALAKQRLGFVERDGQLVVIQPAAERRRTVDYEVKDLLEPGAADASGMAKLIMQVVAPEAWSTSGKIDVNGTKLRVEQASGVHAQVLIFCERLRLARGLPTRSRYPAALLSSEPPCAKLSASLGKQTTFTFLPWTRLADVVRHWQESTGVTILVDWAALARKELAPSSPIACAAIGKPWDEALDAVLEPMGLAWWAVDGETIQITNREALADIEQIEFFPVPKQMREQFTSTEALVEALAKEVEEQTGDDNSATETVIELDAPSGRLIALGSPVVQRFLNGRLADSSPRRHDERDEMQTRAMPIGAP